MAKTVKEALTAGFEGLKKNLIDEFISQGRDASGNWIKQLEVKVNVSNKIQAQLLGADYTYFLENGRKPNANKKNLRGFAAWASSSDGFIYKWCVTKNISTEFAFPIAYVLGRDGFEGKPLVEKVITDSKLNDVVNEVGGAILESVTSDVVKSLNNASN